MPRGATVVLVHGLWLNALSTWLLRRRIARCGYDPHPYSYPTVRLSLPENAERLARYCDALGTRVDLVGHSMGGLVILSALEHMKGTHGRVVLVGSPCCGCFAGRALERLPGGPRLLGRSMSRCLDGPQRFSSAAHEIGVIAGSGGIGLGRIVARGLPEPHDGVVSVEETRFPGARDHIVLHVSHTQMLVSREVARQICAFLDHGEFARARP